MLDAKPPVGIGHAALIVADLEASHHFYGALGLRTLNKANDMAVMELRGGTHLLLFQRGGAAATSDAESPFDQPAVGVLDLMIEGRTFDELDSYRAGLIAGGVSPDPIDEKRYFGHYVFKAFDPDGNTVTISTSHASHLPI